MNTAGHQSEPVSQGEGIVNTSNAFYDLLDYDGPPEIPPDGIVENALVATGSSGATILTGTQHGPVLVRLHIYAEQPPSATG